jgi:hypothetical protein
MRTVLVLLATFSCIAGFAGLTQSANAFAITQKSTEMVNGGYVTTCVDVKGRHIIDGTPVGPYPCNSYFNEQWDYSSGSLVGIGTTSGDRKCLTAQNPSISSPVVLSTCVANNSGQIWSIHSDGKIATSNGRCLDSKGYVGADGQLTAERCSNAVSQQWAIH